MTFTLEHHDPQGLAKRRSDRGPGDSAPNHRDIDRFRFHAHTVCTSMATSPILHTGHIFRIREFSPPDIDTPYDSLTDDELK